MEQITNKKQLSTAYYKGRLRPRLRQLNSCDIDINTRISEHKTRDHAKISKWPRLLNTICCPYKNSTMISLSEECGENSKIYYREHLFVIVP